MPPPAHWRTVRAALRAQWPSKTLEHAGGVVDPLLPKAEFPGACPITLEPCRFPVIASDGRVYERDALLSHLVANGPVSPWTREALAWHVFTVKAW